MTGRALFCDSPLSTRSTRSAIICDVIARIADTRAEVYALAARSFGSLSELILHSRLDRLAELDKADDAQAAGGAS